MFGGRTFAGVVTLALAALTAAGCGGGAASEGGAAPQWGVFHQAPGSFKRAGGECSEGSGGGPQTASPGRATGGADGGVHLARRLRRRPDPDEQRQHDRARSARREGGGGNQADRQLSRRRPGARERQGGRRAARLRARRLRFRGELHVRLGERERRGEQGTRRRDQEEGGA